MTADLTAKYWAPGQFPSGTSSSIEDATSLSFLAELRSAGQASLEILNDASVQPASGGIVTFDVKGTRAFAAICRNRTRVTVAAGEDSDQRTTWDMPGHLARFQDAPIFPPNGLGHVPRVDTFTYNFAHPGYDDPLSVFESATEVCTVEYAQLNASNLPATVDVDGRWGYLQVWDPGFPAHAVSGVGSGTTQILWGSDGDPTGLSTGIGKRCFYEDITFPYTGLYYLFVGADNTFQSFLNAAPLTNGGSVPAGSTGNPENSSYSHTTIFPITATAGAARIAFVVENYPPFGAPNPGGLAAALYIPGYPPTLVWETTSSMRVTSDYVDELPGMTANQVIRLMTEDAQSYSLLSEIDLSSFDDDTDSASASTTELTNITVTVGRDTCLNVIEKIQASYADVRMPPDSWSLEVYNRDTLGGASGVTYAAGTNLTSLVHKTEAALAASVLVVSDPTAWARAGSGDPCRFIELGKEVEPVEISRLAQTALDVFSTERRETTLSAVPLDDTEVPWVNTDFIPGCTATAPWITGTPTSYRVLALGCSVSGDAEELQVAVTLNDRIQELNERIIEELGVS